MCISIEFEYDPEICPPKNKNKTVASSYNGDEDEEVSLHDKEQDNVYIRI